MKLQDLREGFADKVERVINNNFYVYKDEPEKYTIEEEKIKYVIDFHDNGYLEVTAQSDDKPAIKRANEIKAFIKKKVK